jgi:hypothetical protein
VRVEQNVARALEVADKAPVLVGAGIVREGSAEELRQIEMEKPFFARANNRSNVISLAVIKGAIGIRKLEEFLKERTPRRI